MTIKKRACRLTTLACGQRSRKDSSGRMASADVNAIYLAAVNVLRKERVRAQERRRTHKHNHSRT